MQFAFVEICGKQRWVYALTKWEATAFVAVGGSKKAPADEQAVRFGYYDTCPVVWVSDGTQMLIAEPQVVRPSVLRLRHNAEVCVAAPDFKKFATQTKAAQMMLVPVGEREVYVAKLRDLSHGEVVSDAAPLGELPLPGPLEWGRAQLEEVRSVLTLPPEAGLVARWATSGRFMAGLAAVAKATTGESLVWVGRPATEDAPLVVQTEHALDSSTWWLVLGTRRTA